MNRVIDYTEKYKDKYIYLHFKDINNKQNIVNFATALKARGNIVYLYNVARMQQKNNIIDLYLKGEQIYI